MKRYRVRRKAGEWYREHRHVDLAGLVLALGAIWMPAVPGMVPIQSSFLAAASATVAVLIAVVTFACAFVYQSSSPNVLEVRRKYAVKLRSNWLWCVGWVLGGALVILACIPLAYWNAAGAWALAFGATGIALTATVRSLAYLKFAMTS